MLDSMPVMSSGGGGGDTLIRKVIDTTSGSQTLTVDEMTQVVLVMIQHAGSAIFGGYVDENGTFTSVYGNGYYQVNNINGNQIQYSVYSAAAEKIYIVGY